MNSRSLLQMAAVGVLLVAAIGAAPSSPLPACSRAEPLCLRGAGADTIKRFDAEDAESASSAACCAAAVALPPSAGCKAWQLISKAEGEPPACWLMATTAQKTAPGESCTSAALLQPPPAGRANRTSFSGIWVQHGSTSDLVNQSFVVGGDIPVKWRDVEIADGQWDWDATDAAFAEATASGFFVETALMVGPVSPSWIYTTGGVPPVNITPAEGHTQPPIFPDYLSPTYQRLFLRAVDRFAAHIASLPASVKSRIVASQAMFGSTGDDCPWHGAPVDAPITPEKRWGLFSDDQWHNFTMSSSPAICASCECTANHLPRGA